MILPKHIRRGLKKIGAPQIFGVKTDNWSGGERYRTRKFVVYLHDGEISATGIRPRRAVTRRQVRKWRRQAAQAIKRT